MVFRPAPLLTEEEIDLVIDSVLLETLEKSLDSDLDLLQYIEFQMVDVYRKKLRHIRDQVVKDRILIATEMRKRGLKITEQWQTREGVEIRYLCRGYKHECRLLKEFIKSECTVKMAEYIGVDLSGGPAE